VNNFEACLGVELHHAHLTCILGTGVCLVVNLSSVADLENLLRDLFFLVRLKYFKKARDERSSDLLILESLWIGELDCLVEVDILSQESVVLFVRQESTRQALDIASLSQFVPYQISKFVDRNVAAYCTGLWILHWNVIKAITNSNLLGDIATVHDVGSHARYFKLNFRSSIRTLERLKSHLDGCLVHLLGSKINSKSPADGFALDFKSITLETWSYQSFSALINDLNWLNIKFTVALTMLGKLRS